MRRLLPSVLLILSLCGFSHGQTPTADKQAGTTTQNAYFYLSQIWQRTTKNIITGQEFAYADYTQTTGNVCPGSTLPYDTYIACQYQASISELVGAPNNLPMVGILGTDYRESGQPAALPFDYVCSTCINSYLTSAIQAGSLLTISYHARNPWTGNANDNTCGVSADGAANPLLDLINPDTTTMTSFGTPITVYAAWRQQLNSVAIGLQALQAQGAVVLWRPLLEANGTSFWWGNCVPTPPQFQALWQDMFTYLTTTMGLHNLLWVYASIVYGAIDAGQLPALYYYPGTTLVDIVGLDDYEDYTNQVDWYGIMPTYMHVPTWSGFASWIQTWRGYQSWQSLGKPIAYAERGPASTNGTSTVYESLLPGIIANLGGFSYFQAWSSGVSTPGWSIAQNLGASGLMNSANAANQSDVAAVMACLASAAQTYAARLACVVQ